jgi:antimicrobial peptide system SdpA family protein
MRADCPVRADDQEQLSMGRRDVLASADRPHLRWLGLLLIGLAACWCIVLLYVIHPALPFNALKLPAASDVNVSVWVPEGWRFFTRNPREDQTLLYRRQGDGAWASASLGPNMRVSNLLGFGRRARAQGIELGVLIYNQPKTIWAPCEEEPDRCLERTTNVIAVRNRSPEPTLCGSVGVVMQNVVPWGWAISGEKFTMPSKVARFDIQC